ncbi:MAG: winged helix-turn-helix transcriptional regulator, partial [Ferrovibrio sp.]
LTARLRGLVTAGILDAVPNGAHNDYVLTRKGRDLFTVLVALRQWGETHQFPEGACPVELLDRENRQPVGALELRAADGRRLSADDTMIRLRN